VKAKNTPDNGLNRALNSYGFLENALFIFGAGRSGTTLLHSLLDNHREIIVWPFEFSYYSEFEKFRKKSKYPKNEEIPLSALNRHFLNREDVQSFGKELHYSMGVYINLHKVNKQVFFDFMLSFQGEELVSRRDYLKLLALAYHHALNPDGPRPKCFLFEIHGIRDEVLEDFPKAEYLWAYRDPIDNYIAIKKDYFTSFDNKFFCYFPKIYIPGFRYGLLEAALWPVLYTQMWVKTNNSTAKIFKIDLKDIQRKPREVMEHLSDSWGITFSDSLLETSFAGTRFDSNLSSLQKSHGRILQTKSYDPEKHLSVFEYAFVRNKIKGYDVVSDTSFKGFTRFFYLLKNEFPEKILTTGKAVPYLIRLVMTMIAFICVYLNNRFFFVFYKTHIDDPWEL